MADTTSPPDAEEEAGFAHRGSNQSGMRAFNERLVLSLVRRHGALAKMDIARRTGLSAQTISVIMRALEADDLLVRGEPIRRGRVGQPSVPLSLKADSVFFLGVKIGRRSTDVVLVDFLGHIRARERCTYAYPLPQPCVDYTRSAVDDLSAKLGARRGRIAGLGIAVPFELWNWADEVGAPADEMEAWRGFDLRGAIAAFCPWPVYLQNDATAACGAELAFGRHSRLQDFIYFYCGTFVGGGVVLNGSLYSGRTGNAGALGTMPVPGMSGPPQQLIDQASLVLLERALKAKNVDTAPLWDPDADWSDLDCEVAEWLDTAARGLAYAVIAAASVIDFEAAVIDGSLPPAIRARLVARMAEEIHRIDLQGIALPKLEEGSIGGIARALGGASLPLFDRYLIDQNTLMRTT